MPLADSVGRPFDDDGDATTRPNRPSTPPSPPPTPHLCCFGDRESPEAEEEKAKHWRWGNGDAPGVVTRQPAKSLKPVSSVTNGRHGVVGVGGSAAETRPILCYSPKKAKRGQVDLFPR